MSARKITYELKLKNIRQLLYGRQNYSESEQDIKYFTVREEKLDDRKFLLRHFGPELLPGMEKSDRKCIADLMGRDIYEEPWRYGSKGIVMDFCGRIGKKDLSSKRYPNMDALIELNRKLITEREGKILATSLEDYLMHIRAAEEEVDAKYRIPGPQLNQLLEYSEDCLTAYDRKKDTRYLAMTLSWLLVGALVRTRMVELSDVLEDYSKAIGWDEAGAIPRGTPRTMKESEGAIPRCLTPIPPVDRRIGLVGREAIKKEVLGMLEGRGRTALVSGLGGIGKTAVMQWVCNDLKEEGRYVAWIDCGDSIREDLLVLGDALGVPVEEPGATYKMIIRALKDRLYGLLYLFLDGLTEDLGREELGDLNSLNAHIMATSRKMNDAFPAIELRELEDIQAVTMFFRYYNGDTDRRYEGAARAIVNSVNRHTLLIELLAKAAKRSGGTLGDFNARLEAEGVYDVFKRKLETAHDGNTTIEDCVIRLYEASHLSEAQKHILRLFSIFTPEKEIYYKVAEWADLDMDAMDELVVLAWIERSGVENNYKIHQIIRDSLARQMMNRDDELEIEKYGSLIVRVTDTDSYMSKCLEHKRIREHLVLASDVAAYLEIRIKSILLQNVRQDENNQLIDNTSVLFHSISKVYIHLGEYNKSLSYLKKALFIIENIPEIHYLRRVLIYNDIGWTYHRLGYYKEALQNYKRAIDMLNHDLIMDQAYRATIFNNVALVYSRLGNYGLAMKYYEDARLIREAQFGTEHLYTAETYYYLAWLHLRYGNYKYALQYSWKTLCIRQQNLGNEHPDTAAAYHNFAQVLSGYGLYNKAIAYFEKAITIREKVLGDEHPYTATSYHHIAWGFWKRNDKDDYKQALKYLKRALQIRERMLGENHPDTAETYDHIAWLFFHQRDYKNATIYFEKALEIRKNVLGIEHPYTAETYYHIAWLFLYKGQYQKSLYYYNTALSIIETTFGVNHPEKAEIFKGMAWLYLQQHDIEKALTYYNNAKRISEELLGVRHPDTAQVYNDMGTVYLDMGEYDRAFDYFEKALSIRKTKLGSNHPDTKAAQQAIEQLKNIR